MKKFKEIINDTSSGSMDVKQKNALRLIVQLLNVLCCFLMISTAGFRLVDSQVNSNDITSAVYYVVTLYLFVFSMIILLSEMDCKFVLKNLEIMTTDICKGLIFMIIGILLFDQRRMLDLMSSLSLCVVGFCNFVMGCFSKIFSDSDDQENDSLLSFYEKDNIDIRFGGMDESMEDSMLNKSAEDLDTTPLIIDRQKP